MGIKRVIDTDFWNDEKVLDCFSPEDKYFMLYLLTNTHTRQIGVYRLNIKKAAFEMGYTIDSVNVLLERFEYTYRIIKYNSCTQEVAIINYLRYAIVKGGKPLQDCIIKDAEEVKDKSLLWHMYPAIKDYKVTREGEKENVYDFLRKFLQRFKPNDNDNDNDNDNEESYPLSLYESSNESLHESGNIQKTKVGTSKNTTKKKVKKFVKPTVLEVKEYLKSISSDVDAEKFYDFYESNGWKVSRNPMKDWKACCRNWTRNDKKGGVSQYPNAGKPTQTSNFTQRDYGELDDSVYANFKKG